MWDCFQPFFIHSLLSHPCMTPACQAPRDRRGQRHGKKLAPRPHRVDNPEESTVSPQSFSCPGHMLFSFSICSLFNFFQPISLMQNHIYIYIYIRDEGKMAANLSFSPRHTLCPSSKHTRLGFHWVDGPQVWVFFFFFFLNFAMSSLVECRIVPQPRIKPEPPP